MRIIIRTATPEVPPAMSRLRSVSITDVFPHFYNSTATIVATITTKQRQRRSAVKQEPEQTSPRGNGAVGQLWRVQQYIDSLSLPTQLRAVCPCVCHSECVCVCVCVRARARARARVCVCVCVCEHGIHLLSPFLCVFFVCCCSFSVGVDL